jgi:hypothetical protein
VLRIDGVDEVRAAALLFARAPRQVQAGIRTEAKAWAPSLQAAARRRATDPVSLAVARSGKVTATRQGLVAVFGSGRWKGRDLARLARPWEFGTSDPQALSYPYLARYRRRAVRVKRRTQVQVPARVETGRMVYPAVADVTPDLVARWVRACAQAVTRG